uniref:Protein tyrosine phosphatase receptor type N n=1 Tax=Varanus komodoensis TaxID=61221 RepID=A0A8D2Q8E0_VARKO
AAWGPRQGISALSPPPPSLHPCCPAWRGSPFCGHVVLADGLFGQCQQSSLRDRPYFQVTAPVLQRLQDVLRHLMAQGLSWQDDVTQYVISQEMERIPRLHLPAPWGSVAEESSLGSYLAFSGLLFQFSYSDVPFQDHSNPEPPILLDRAAASKTLFGASTAPSYRGQQGADGGQLFQDLGALYLTQEEAGKSKARVLNKQNSKTDSPLQDYGESSEDGRKSWAHLAEPGESILACVFMGVPQVTSLTFRVRQNHQNLTLGDVANRAAQVKPQLETEVGVKILQMGVGQRNEAATYPHPTHFGDTFRSVLLTFVLLACVAGIVITAAVVFCLRQHARQREKERLAGLGPEGAADSTFEYQELCRQHMAAKSLFGRAEAPPPPAPAENSRVSSVSSQFSDAPQASPSSHSSTPSWCEEPVQSNMDISTGHMILAYMEDHLRNRDRLAKEWQALCAYQAEPNTCDAAQHEANIKKTRSPDYVPYDHARIKLKAESNPSRSDFINASPIIDHDPRMPAYIATQGPLSHTIADFWQMVWENGCTVIVMLSPLVEDGVKQCDRYWPDEGSSLYHIYEVNLVSEHIWCEDFLVRSFYLKNVQSQETRTLTQFHFLSWPAEGIPTTARPLLDFRRKVNKCYRGRSCPVVVHCSDGAGRTGTYILIDMVLNRMAKGVKEIDIAATLEHVRDQRPGMVQTKDQFEFALTAVAEEVNAILKALPQ